jgi:hypothetical protein
VSESSEKPELDALLAYWQPLLKLADWDVIVRYERHMESSGLCSRALDYKRATIRILDPIDWQDTVRVQDVEHDLVHELLHLHFAPFHTPNDTPMGTAEEQAVESLARAFIALKRSPPAAGKAKKK